MSPLWHCLCVTIGLAGQVSAPESTASVYGRILTGNGEPLPMARVMVEAGVFRTIVLHSGQRLEWNIVFGAPEWPSRRAPVSTPVADGHVDSVARGFVSTDTATGFTYERFGIRLLRAALQHSSSDSSRVLSPLSAGQALALALGAAKDSTALAIARALEIGSLSADGLAVRNHWFNEMVRTRRDIVLRVANGFWVDTSAMLRPAFARWARDRYGAAVQTLPLRSAQFVAIL